MLMMANRKQMKKEEKIGARISACSEKIFVVEQ